eukprot:621913-Pyramimonas_sp.AAC.2
MDVAYQSVRNSQLVRVNPNFGSVSNLWQHRPGLDHGRGAARATQAAADHEGARRSARCLAPTVLHLPVSH